MKFSGWRWALCVGLSAGLLAACGGSDGEDVVTATDEFNEPVLTDKGLVSGGTMTQDGRTVHLYKGIPYAAPPVGDLRWKPPQPATAWTGVRDATRYSLMAPQPYPASPVYESVPESGMGEDVLYLNVSTPAKRRNEKLPVMVLFHGGGLTTGSANRVSDNSPGLPLHGVVSVTVQHRIGALGYMAHPELTAESARGSSGNYGQLDLVAALQWVKANAAAFGGNPDNVTIWGHSGGGMKTNWLLASPLAKGLFHRAIHEAGWTTGGTALATTENFGRNLQAKLGATSLADMRKKTWQEIVAASNAADSGYTTAFTVDNWSLPDTIGNLILAGRHSDVPYMVGNGGGEITAANPARGQFLQQMAKVVKSPIYTYIFTHVPKNWAAGGVAAYHGLEVSYQYGTINTVSRIYGTSLLPARPDLNPDPGITEKDHALSDQVMTAWTTFAATGNPNNPTLGATWPTYGDADQYLDIGVPSLVKTGFATITTKQFSR